MCRMNLFFFEVSNSLQDQQFVVEADDLVTAHMQAIDFARELDERIKKKYDMEETTQVISVARLGMLWATEAGAEEYIDSVEVYCEDEDE